ncbi:hypothetical protein OH146_04260 [Salinibacterium sp. SYSU T00001]|uniref:hypothetical protein n=1 Tax=Homoserinimonas sedimenticola TaxID=2986805 RepID=UPI0022366D7D|nr:hypothetical protein [Salinibacterium sedimenticola]MCW4384983.1 hypothetical protein [Salinibacterium sedimenticola]
MRVRGGSRLGLLAVALLLAGCGAVADVSETDVSVTAAPQHSSSAPGATPSAASGAAGSCPIGELVAGKDVVAAGLVSDARGEYCAVSPSPDSAAMLLDDSVVVSDSLEKWGFTREDALEAQRRTVTFVVEEALDSALLDTSDEGAFARWQAAAPYRFVDFAPPEDLLLQGLPALARDGGPRSAQTQIEVVRVEGQGGKAGPTSILVRVEALSRFRPADGRAEIPVTTRFALAFDAAGGIVGISYGYSSAE